MTIQTTSKPSRGRKPKKNDYSDVEFTAAELAKYPSIKEVKARNRKLKKEQGEPFKEGDAITVKVSYHLGFVCPSCQHKNSQVFRNIHTTVGPEWSAGVKCEKCKLTWGVIEDTDID